MLGKLIKYENRNVKKALLPLALGIILVSILGTIMLKISLFTSENFEPGSVIATVLLTGSSLMLGFSILAIISAIFVAFFLIYQRYYRSMFTDEGYLTFTLPVKPNQILFSKILVGVIWAIITAISTFIGITIFVLFGTSTDFINTAVIDEILSVFKTAFNMGLVSGIDVAVFITEFVITILLQTIASFTLVFLSLTIGCQIAKKHKIIASIVFFFLISAIASTIESSIEVALMITSFKDIMLIETLNSVSDFYWIMIPSIIFSAVMSVVYFVINNFIISKKLNIE